jgi:release factor glutamine methyltransferase
MSNTEPWTVGRLLNWTADYLKQRGVDASRLEAEILLAEARGCSRIELYTAFADVANDETRVAYRELVRRRAEGMPVAYLVGRREFFSLDFRVTPDVLIPRPETEMVVVALLDLVKERPSADAPIRIADVGTGSGILAVCAAKHIRRAEVTAIDISPAAIAIAQENAQRHEVADRVRFVEGDLFASVAEDARFDYIVSNPPYVSTAELAKLSADVRDHEPHTALVAGEQGTEVIERLLPQAAERLVPGGGLLVEVSPMIADRVRQLIDAQPQLTYLQTIADHAGLARVVEARRK